MSGKFTGDAKKAPLATMFSGQPPRLSRTSIGADERTITMETLPLGIVGPLNLRIKGRLGQVTEDTFSSPDYEALEETLMQNFSRIATTLDTYQRASTPRNVVPQQPISNTPPPLVTKNAWTRWMESPLTEFKLAALDDPSNFDIFYVHFKQKNTPILPTELVALYTQSRGDKATSRDTTLPARLEAAKKDFITNVMKDAHDILTKKNSTEEEKAFLNSMRGLKFPNHQKEIIDTMRQEIKDIDKIMKNEQKILEAQQKKEQDKAKKLLAEQKKQEELKAKAIKKENDEIASALQKYLNTTKKNIIPENILSITNHETKTILDHHYTIEPRKIKALDCVQYLYPLYLEKRVIDNLVTLTGHERMKKKHHMAETHKVVTKLQTALEASATEYRRLYNARIAANTMPSQVDDLHMIVLNMHHLTYVNAAIKTQLEDLKQPQKDKKYVPEALKGILENLQDLNTQLLDRQVKRLKAACHIPGPDFVRAFNEAKAEIYEQARPPVKGMAALHTYLEETTKLARSVPATLQHSAEDPGTATGQHELNVKRLLKK